MSYEAWGDDDDGLDGVRERYRETLLEDGWLDDEQAKKLRASSFSPAEASQILRAMNYVMNANVDVMDFDPAEWRALQAKVLTICGSPIIKGLGG